MFRNSRRGDQKKTDLVSDFVMEAPPVSLRYSCGVQGSGVQRLKQREVVVILLIYSNGIIVWHDCNRTWSTAAKPGTLQRIVGVLKSPVREFLTIS